MSGCGSCGPSWDCSDAGWTPKAAEPTKFEVTNKLGPCVPSSALKSLPEFLKWFSENGIPVICQLSALKDSTCSVLSGKDGKLAAIPFSVMFNDCLPCVDFLKRLDGATSCIPRLPAEQASLVASVDPVSGVIAWRSPPVVDCEVLTNLLKPGPGACYPETTNVPRIVLGQTATGDLEWMPPPAIDCAALLPLLDGPASCIPRILTEQATVVASVDPATGVIAWRLPPAIDCDVLTNLLKPGPGACYPETTNSPAKVFALTDTGDIEWMPIDCKIVKTALEGAACIPAGTIAKNVGFDATGKLIQMAPAPAATQTPLTVLDTQTVNMTAGTSGDGHTGVKADVIIDPNDNLISLTTTNGLVAPCSKLKAMLETGACIPNVAPPTGWQDEPDEIQYAFGLRANGTLVRQKRRPLVRISAEGDSTPPVVTKSDLVKNIAAPGGRMIHKWVTGFVGGAGGDSTLALPTPGTDSPPNPNIGSQPVDIVSTSDKVTAGFSEYVVQHDGHYLVCTAVYLRLKMAAAQIADGKGWSMLSAIVIAGNYNKDGLTTGSGTTTEQRFGEDTVECNASSTSGLVTAGYDVVHAGCMQFYMAKGTRVWVRSWVSGHTPASNDTPVDFSICPGTGVTFSIQELPRDFF